MSREFIPRRNTGRRRDYHGRGLRGPVVPPTLPAWRTRSDRFDAFIAGELASISEHVGSAIERIDCGVLDVPDSDPAPWESGVPLSRFLPFERPSKKQGRVVFYRMPMMAAAGRVPDAALFLHQVVVEQLASALGMDSTEVDPLA